MPPKKRKSIKKLPKYVGMLADSNYEYRTWIHNLILELNPESVVVTAESFGVDAFIEKIAVLRGDLHFKKFENDPFELRVNSPAKAERVRDFMFLSYVKHNQGHLFFFPVWYDTGPYGMSFSKRMQSVILLAHQMKLPYDIIRVDEDGNDISATY